VLFYEKFGLSQFRHLFVRAGMVGVIHIENDHNKVRGKVYFTPYAKDGIHRDPDLEGRTVGKNTLLIASLAYQISQTLGKGPGEKTAALRDGIKAAIRAAMQVDDQGYEGDLFPTKETLTEEDRVIRGAQLIRQSVAPAADIICPAKTSGTGGKEEPSVIIACRPIPGYLLAEPLPEDFRCTKRWHILDDVLEQAPVPRINVAMAIVMAGHQHVLNRLWGKGAQKTEAEKDIWAILTRADYWNPQDRAPDYVTLNDGDRPAMPDRSGKNMPRLIGNIEKPFGFNVPIAQFDKLTVAEREEIDGLRSISNLLKLYMRDRERNTKPISIAVFGPPGSGKSFAVKQIAETIDDQKAIQPLEYNVAQFRTVEDLGGVFTKVSSVNNQDRTPLVFFDEFDSVLNDQPLGWLKYFLAPMQDGTFQGDNIGRAIFVFAGGIHTSFEKFDPRTAPPDEELGYKISDDYKQRVRQFTEQKGPDFISRLRGHMNILPVNTEPGRIKHFIRRALQLRSMCERFSFTFTHPQDTKYRMAAVDEAVLYALLTIDCYRHGVRSMEAIVQMCAPIDGRIQLSSLPSQAQLNMHVDAEEFFIRLYRGRWRAACEGGPKGRDVMVLLELWSRLEQLFTPQEAAEIHDQIKQKYQNRHTR
jgi:hypothetical protein